MLGCILDAAGRRDILWGMYKSMCAAEGNLLSNPALTIPSAQNLQIHSRWIFKECTTYHDALSESHTPSHPQSGAGAELRGRRHNRPGFKRASRMSTA